jgi:hypothetical protein
MLADLQGRRVDALGDVDRRLHAALVLQGDRIVRRVDDHHRRLRHRRHHAAALAGLAHLFHLALDDRVAFGLLELLLQFAQRHFLPLVPDPVLEQIIGHRHHRHEGDHGAEQLERQRLRQRQHRHRIDALERHMR